jgi:hypothetical protein
VSRKIDDENYTPRPTEKMFTLFNETPTHETWFFFARMHCAPNHVVCTYESFVFEEFLVA